MTETSEVQDKPGTSFVQKAKEVLKNDGFYQTHET